MKMKVLLKRIRTAFYTIAFCVVLYIFRAPAQPKTRPTLRHPCSDAETARLLRSVSVGDITLETAAASRLPCAPLHASDDVITPSAPDPKWPVRVFDVFPFNSEADMLEIRLRELAPVVSHFVIIECVFDEHGAPKDLTFFLPTVRARWQFVADRITYAPCTHDNVAGTADGWAYNHAAYRAGARALRRLQPGPRDFVVTGDLDELVSAHAVESILKNTQAEPRAAYLTRAHMTMYTERQCFASDWPTAPGARDFRFPVVARVAALSLDESDDALLDIRTRAYQRPESFAGAMVDGAHMTWRADPLLVLLKLRSNVEQDPALIKTHALLSANVTAREVSSFVDDLKHKNGRRFKPENAHRISTAHDCVTWTPRFFVRNRKRFQF